MKKLYKSPESKLSIMKLYEEKLLSLNIKYEEIDVETSFGRTRVIKTGNENGKIVVLFHGINAGAPLTIEAVKGIGVEYLIYAIDTIGQATKSDETRLNILDNSYALWSDEVLTKLHIDEASFIGISYGAYILQNLITHKPEKVAKCIFVVPSGLVNGRFMPSMAKLTFPLLRFLITRKDAHLKAFIKSFVPEDDEFMFKLQKAIMNGVNMDYRRPKLLKENDVKNFDKPVYMIVADDDIFFPGEEAVKRAGKLFSNFKGVHVLKNCKHMPHSNQYSEIQEKIKEWIH